MSRWTKKAALERMRTNQELQQVYQHYPLARLLVESAAKVKRHLGYNRIDFYYAYKDWMMAATGHENTAFWICIKMIDDLLPPDAADLQIEGESSIYTGNPTLPGIPPRPERVSESSVHVGADGKRRFRPLSLLDLDGQISLEKQRHSRMRQTLENLAKGEAGEPIGTDDMLLE